MRLFVFSLLFGCLTSTATPLDPGEWSEDTSSKSKESDSVTSKFLWSTIWELALLKQELANQTLSVWESNGWVYRSGGHRNSYGSVGRSGGGPIGASPLSATESRGGGMAKAGVVGSSAPSAEKRRPPVVDSGVRPQGDLRAGSTDDNADFDQYLSFLQSWTEKPGVSGRFDAMDVSGRRFVRIKDAHGNPLPGARVSIVDPRTEHVVWSGTTYGDGRMPFYPSLNPSGGPVVDGLDTPPGGWLVQVKMDEQMQTQRWSSDATEFEMSMDWAKDSGPVRLDVAFVIDTTGSMSDEIARIKSTLLSVTEQLGGEKEVSLRYGAVLYRDLGDEYVTSRYPFTTDVKAFDSALQQIHAGGGGDMPESMNQGLAEAVSALEWDEGVAKVAFVIADAPPHTDYQDDIGYGRSAAAALHHGIRIHTVAASGLNDLGSLVFRQVAQLTRGKFIFIEYGSTAASAADHGVTGRVQSNNLDDILYQQLRDEIDGWGRVKRSDVAANP